MNEYVAIGTYPNGNRKALTVQADSTSDAIVKAVKFEKSKTGSNFIKIEVADTYGDIQVVEED